MPSVAAGDEYLAPTAVTAVAAVTSEYQYLPTEADLGSTSAPSLPPPRTAAPAPNPPPAVDYGKPIMPASDGSRAPASAPVPTIVSVSSEYPYLPGNEAAAPAVPPMRRDSLHKRTSGSSFESTPAAVDFGMPLPAFDAVPMVMDDDVYAAIDEDVVVADPGIYAALDAPTSVAVDDEYLAPTAVAAVAAVTSEYQYLPAGADAASTSLAELAPALKPRAAGPAATSIEHNSDLALSLSLTPRERTSTEWQRPQVTAASDEVYGAVDDVSLPLLAASQAGVPILSISRTDADAMLQSYFGIDGAFLLRQRTDGSQALSVVHNHSTFHFVVQENPGGRCYLVNGYLLANCASLQDVVNHLKTTLEPGTQIACLLSFLVSDSSA